MGGWLIDTILSASKIRQDNLGQRPELSDATDVDCKTSQKLYKQMCISFCTTEIERACAQWRCFWRYNNVTHRCYNHYGNVRWLYTVFVTTARDSGFMFLNDVLFKDKTPEYNEYNTRFCRKAGMSPAPKLAGVYLPLIDMKPSDPTTVLPSITKRFEVTQKFQSKLCYTSEKLQSTTTMQSPIKCRSCIDIKEASRIHSDIVPSVLALHALTGCY